MQVVQLVQRLAPGGLEVLALDLLRTLPEGWRGTIVSLEGEASHLVDDWARLRPYQDQIHGLNKPDSLSFATIWKLSRLLRHLRADVLHTHHIGPLLYGGLGARLAGGIRHVHTEHDVWHLQQPRARQLEGVLLRLCHPAHVALNSDMASSLTTQFGRAVHVIANGVDTERYSIGPAVRTPFVDHISIGAAGRLEPVKGMDILIDAFAGLVCNWQGRAPLSLRIAGHGSERARLQNQIDDLVAAGKIAGKQIELVGLVEEMPDFFATLDLFVQPSRAEGLPLAPLEAMSAGVPVVCTPTGGAGSLASAGAVVSDAIDDAALQMAMAHALESKANAAQLRAAIVENFSLVGMAQQYHALYEGRAFEVTQ